VDKYGRKLATSHEKDLLRKFYRIVEDGEDGGFYGIAEDGKEDGPPRVDYARGEESSEEEEGKEDTKESDEEEDV